MSFRPCPACKGARLKPEVLAVTVGERNIHEFTQLSVTAALALPRRARADADRGADRRARIVKEIRERLSFLDNVGVGYLALDRASATLSGGEAQRLRLATQIGSQLVGVLYILDEPSIGLHQRDNDRLIGTLERLRDLGNTVRRRRARRADDAQRRLARRHGAGRGRARRPRRRRGAGGEGRAEPQVDHRRSSSPARARSRCRRGGRPTTAGFTVRGRHAAQPEGDRRRLSDRPLHRRHRRLGLGQVDARQRDRLQGAREPAARRCG